MARLPQLLGQSRDYFRRAQRPRQRRALAVGTLEQIDAPLILKFLKHLENGRGNKQTSRNTRLAAVK